MRRPAVLLALAAALLVAAGDARAQTLKGIRKEFAEIGDAVVPATVTVGAPNRKVPSSCGVIVHPDGYVLSDADATFTGMDTGKDGERIKHHGRDAIVRMPAPDYRAFRAVLLRRDAETDSSLLKITDPIDDELPFVPIGSSDPLKVGSFSIVVGNTFGAGNEGEPSLSMGVVSALVRRTGNGGGRYETLYTSATVVMGSNGGPCVDAEGRLVGVVSSFDRGADSPFRALGIVTPIDKLRPKYEDLEDYAKVFPDPKTLPPRSREAGVLEDAFEIVARHVHPSLVSIEVKRAADAETKIKLKRPVPGPDGRPQIGPDGRPLVMDIEIPKYPGPYSGLVLTTDGEILTGISNLWEFDKIEEIVVHLPDGRSLPGKVLGRDVFHGVALLEVEAKDLVPLPRAAPEDYRVGRFALAFGNPFGAERQAAPLFTMGLVSGLRRSPHPLIPELRPLQTDAGMNDSMVGGAVVTLEGKLLGMSLLVMPDRYGRNSGVGFAVPLGDLAESLPKLRAGKDVGPGLMRTGLEPAPDDEGFILRNVQADGPAAKAGLMDGDLLLAIGGKAADEFEDLMEMILFLRSHGPGARVKVTVKRGRKTLDTEVVLAPQPPDKDPWREGM